MPFGIEYRQGIDFAHRESKLTGLADWPVSWLAPVSASVPTQYPQTNTLLAASPDSGTTVPGGAVSGLCRVRGCDSSVDRNGAPGQVVLKFQRDYRGSSSP